MLLSAILYATIMVLFCQNIYFVLKCRLTTDAKYLLVFVLRANIGISYRFVKCHPIIYVKYFIPFKVDNILET